LLKDVMNTLLETSTQSLTCLHNTLLISADYEFTPFEVLEILKQLIN